MDEAWATSRRRHPRVERGPARAWKFAYDSVARVRASAGVRSARSGVVALRT